MSKPYVPEYYSYEFLGGLKCPEDYDDARYYAADAIIHYKLIAEYHPELTHEEVLEKRHEWFVYNNCQGWTTLSVPPAAE